MSRNPDRQTTFQFKRFAVSNKYSAMKISTDGVLLGAWCHIISGGSALDVGTGTGLIALMVAQRGMSDVTAVEIDRKAADEARCNFENSPWKDNITLIEGDFTDLSLPQGPYDLIVSNPPYFNNGVSSADRARATARHECTLTYHSLLSKASSMLNAHGRIAMVSPADRSDEIEFHASMARFNLLRRTNVCTVSGKAPSRVLWEFGFNNVAPEIDEIYLRDERGDWSEEYRRLTHDFYLHI